MKNSQRILAIFLLLLKGRQLKKITLANDFGVSPRSIQRDLATLRDILETSELGYRLTFDEVTNYFKLKKLAVLEPQEILLITKIMLESRSLPKNEMEDILNHLIDQVAPEEKKKISQLIGNEKLLYLPLTNSQPKKERIWELSQSIPKKQALTITYQKNSGERVERTVLPVSLFFSEYYFYLLCYNPQFESYLYYRVDRIEKLEKSSKKIYIDQKDRLEEGELRKKVHLMYAGQELTFTFQFWGIVEAALDKLPTARVIQTHQDSVVIEAIAFDRGVLMWLLSQGSLVKVLSPIHFQQKIKKELMAMLAHY